MVATSLAGSREALLPTRVSLEVEFWSLSHSHAEDELRQGIQNNDHAL